jgi:Lar family restriction alleviation protein
MKLKPCPFCGGEPQIQQIDSVESLENAGATYIECSKCGVSSKLYFGELDGSMEERWNGRVGEKPLPSDELPDDYETGDY